MYQSRFVKFCDWVHSKQMRSKCCDEKTLQKIKIKLKIIVTNLSTFPAVLLAFLLLQGHYLETCVFQPFLSHISLLRAYNVAVRYLKLQMHYVASNTPQLTEFRIMCRILSKKNVLDIVKKLTKNDKISDLIIFAVS